MRLSPLGGTGPGERGSRSQNLNVSNNGYDKKPSSSVNPKSRLPGVGGPGKLAPISKRG
jgi:hypothetical protein